MQSPTLQISRQRANTTQSKILSGRTFLVTRTSEGNATERRKLERFGAKVIELPSISIYPPSSWKKSDSAISRLEEFDWIVLTSANGVKMFFNRVKRIDPKMFERLRKLEADKKPRFACVGPSTKRALAALGFSPLFFRFRRFATMFAWVIARSLPLVPIIICRPSFNR